MDVDADEENREKTKNRRKSHGVNSLWDWARRHRNKKGKSGILTNLKKTRSSSVFIDDNFIDKPKDEDINTSRESLASTNESENKEWSISSEDTNNDTITKVEFYDPKADYKSKLYHSDSEGRLVLDTDFQPEPILKNNVKKKTKRKKNVFSKIFKKGKNGNRRDTPVSKFKPGSLVYFEDNEDSRNARRGKTLYGESRNRGTSNTESVPPGNILVPISEDTNKPVTCPPYTMFLDSEGNKITTRFRKGYIPAGEYYQGTPLYFVNED